MVFCFYDWRSYVDGFFLIGPVALKQDIKMLMKNGERRKDRVVVLFIPAFERAKRLIVKKFSLSERNFLITCGFYKVFLYI